MSKRRPLQPLHPSSTPPISIPRGGASFLRHRAGRAGSRSPSDDTASTLEKGSPPAESPISAAAAAAAAAAADDHDDRWNYAILLALYTLQGIPMGLSASIPFLIQQKVKSLAEAAAAAAPAATSAASRHPQAAKMAYNAQAIFALCSWPFSLKLLWAPVVDSVFWRRFGRRKSWLVPVQTLAGLLMFSGSSYVEEQLGLGQLGTGAGAGAGAGTGAGAGVGTGEEGGAKDVAGAAAAAAATAAGASGLDVRGVTAFFFALYFLMATQDIAVDGWALTMLSKRNRGRGPVCNSIGQNIGYFLSFVGFLAFNDAESSENLWRPLLGLPSRPGTGIVSLGGFIKFCGVLMLSITTLVALFKTEASSPPKKAQQEQGSGGAVKKRGLSRTKSHDEIEDDGDNDAELDAAELGLRETYKRLWAVCQLPAVRGLFLVLITYRLPTALSDNVKFLKAVEFGLSKQTTALLSPTLILPLGIAVPIVAARVWHGRPLTQFMDAYKVRVTLTALFDVAMLLAVRTLRHSTDLNSRMVFWFAIIGSTGLQAIVHSLQFNGQMTFFAQRVDPAIGGSYMTLLNTAANLGGTWPASFVMYLMGQLTVPPDCAVDTNTGEQVCTGGRDAYFPLQALLSILGLVWIFTMGNKVKHIAELPDKAWRTHIEKDEHGVEMGNKENEKEKKRKSKLEGNRDPKSE